MATYTKSLSSNFSNGINSNQFHEEINENNGIIAELVGINVKDDIVYIIFNSSLGSNELIVLNSIVSIHVPIEPITQPELYIAPNTNIIKFEHESSTYKLFGGQSSHIIISKDTQGDYSSIAEAIKQNNNHGVVFEIYPGQYIENNPIIIPIGSALLGKGSGSNTVIIAQNPDQDLIIMNPSSVLERVTLVNANAPGSRGVYFDGSIDGTGKIAYVKEIIVVNCDIGIEASNGPDMLIAFSAIIQTSVAPTSAGIQISNGGEVVGCFLTAIGVPGYFPITNGYNCIGYGSSISATSANSWFNYNGITIDNGGEAELSGYTSGYCVNGINIGPNGIDTVVRGTLINMINSFGYDLSISSSDANVELFSTTLDLDKIHNPHNATIHGILHTAKKQRKLFGYYRRYSNWNNSSTIINYSGRRKI